MAKGNGGSAIAVVGMENLGAICLRVLTEDSHAAVGYYNAGQRHLARPEGVHLRSVEDLPKMRHHWIWLCEGPERSDDGVLNIEKIFQAVTQIGLMIRKIRNRPILVMRTCIPSELLPGLIYRVESISGKTCGEGWGFAFWPVAEVTIQSVRSPSVVSYTASDGPTSLAVNKWLDRNYCIQRIECGIMP